MAGDHGIDPSAELPLGPASAAADDAFRVEPVK